MRSRLPIRPRSRLRLRFRLRLRLRSRLRLRRGQCRPEAVAEELQQVVGRADEGPLAPHLLETAEGEAAEASRLLDLTEGGFDDALAPRVDRLPLGGLELGGHGRSRLLRR